MIKVGHASISEKGTVNGTKGDQTKKEVCILEWWNKGWDTVLRPKSSDLAEKSAKACEDGCKNDNIGYGQGSRNSAYTSYKKVGDMSKIEKSNTDCSAYQTLCAIAGGCEELNYTTNAPTTSNMESKFKATGKYEVLKDKKYLTSDAYLKRGDILVKKGSHTVMALENGSKAGQTGNPYPVPYITLVKGSKGDYVRWLQYELNNLGYNTGGIDGDYGSKTYNAVKSYQKAKGLVVDGIAGPKTIKALKGF